MSHLLENRDVLAADRIAASTLSTEHADTEKTITIAGTMC